MKLLRYFILPFSITALLLLLFLPDRSELARRWDLLLLAPALCTIVLSRFRKYALILNPRINLVSAFFVIMYLVMLLGNLNYYVVLSVFPGYENDITRTNLYWIGCMGFFAAGVILHQQSGKKAGRRQAGPVYPLSLRLVIVLFILSLLSVSVAFFSLGLIPFIGGVGTGERYTGFSGSSLPVRFWSLCVLSGLFSAALYLFHARKKLYLLFWGLSFVISLFFIIRVYPFLLLASTVVAFLFTMGSARKITLTLLLISILYPVSNMLFIDHRTGEITNPVRNASSLHYIQRNFIYTTFNEYSQLNIIINRYDEPLKYGETFLSVPVSLIPAPVLAVFKIDKQEIQRNNSAVITAGFLNSTSSKGLRIGITGELFINFGFYGMCCMILFGIAISYIHNKLNYYAPTDFRHTAFILFYGLFIYALISQIDAISSMLANYFIVVMMIMILSKKRIYGT
ncbi:MAG TPA: hypothetical protein P5531_00050 [Bacteroidales bacterium]|nr:hypothetical protein [Bacteroidales bacterium]HSA42053.1 hypothetical protein [Bacteroidales bacterium]